MTAMPDVREEAKKIARETQLRCDTVELELQVEADLISSIFIALRRRESEGYRRGVEDCINIAKKRCLVGEDSYPCDTADELRKLKRD